MSLKVPCNRETLRELAKRAKKLGKAHVDLSEVLPVEGNLYIEVDNLFDVVANDEGPEVSLHWDEAAALTVQKTDGGVLGTFKVKF